MTNKFLRRKGRWGDREAKYVIEEMIEGKGKYIKTIPPVEELLRILCLGKLSREPKEQESKEVSKESQSFAQDLLRVSSEPKQDETTSCINPVEKFKKAQDKIMEEILK